MDSSLHATTKPWFIGNADHAVRRILHLDDHTLKKFCWT
jgi:hypothetical protein